MIGLLYIGFFGVYLLLSGWLTDWAARKAKARGIAGWKWGLPMALLMYHLVFWDWVPTMVAHQYYCSTEAGFWVYKTVDEWKAENPGVMEGLVVNKGTLSQFKRFDDGHGKTNIYLLNERFNWIVTQQDISSLLTIIRTDQQVVDVKRNEILARYINFSSGNSVKNTIGPPGPIKLWLKNKRCDDGGKNQDKLRNFRNNFMGEDK